MNNIIQTCYSQVYTGAELVAAALSNYYCELEQVAINGEQEQAAGVTKWIRENQFFLLIHKDTREIMGIRTTYEDEFQPWKILFTTEYIPVKCNPVDTPPFSSADDIATVANVVLERFLCEVWEMRLTSAMPLFLLEHSSYNDYLAWSLAEKKHVTVHGYKSYRHEFLVNDIASISSPSSSVDRYMIIPPSDELAKWLGLHLDSSVYRKKCWWDTWVPRAQITGCQELIPEYFRTRYSVCIETLNRSYTRDMGHDIEFSQLEKRVQRLEQLCRLKAPKFVISDEIALIERVLPVLENLR